MPAFPNLLPKFTAITSIALLIGLIHSKVNADLIDDFTGYEVSISVSTVSNGGKDFNVEVFGANSATIGPGAEFVLVLTAGDFGGGDNQNFLDIDFDQNGIVSATAHQSFYYGAFYFNQNPSFDLNISLTHPSVEVLSTTKSGIMASGSHVVNGNDPITWSFYGTSASASSYQIGFFPTPFDVPKLELTATSIPEPVALPVFCGAVVLFIARRKRGK